MIVQVGVKEKEKEKETVTVIVSFSPVSKMVFGSDVNPIVESGPGDMVQ